MVSAISRNDEKMVENVGNGREFQKSTKSLLREMKNERKGQGSEEGTEIKGNSGKQSPSDGNQEQSTKITFSSVQSVVL